MLPKLNVKIGANTKDLEKGMGRARASVAKFATGAAKAVATAMIGFGVVGVKLALDLDAALAETSTLLEGTSEEMDALKRHALDLGEAFGTSATEQVKGFYQAISAGSENVEAAAVLMESANKLAKGGVTDITTAVDVLSSAINVYASSGMTAADASDVLFVAMKAGKTTIGELGSSLGKVLPVAAAVGLGFDEVAAAVATMTTLGISTAESVTGLKQVLAGVLKPTKDAGKAADALGLDFSAAALEAQGLGGFLGSLATATGGSAEELSKLFGSQEAVVAIMALLNDDMSTFNDTMKDMGTRTGETDSAVGKIQASLSDRFWTALNKVKIAATELGDKLLVYIVPAIEKLVEQIPNIEEVAASMATYFENTLMPAFDKFLEWVEKAKAEFPAFIEKANSSWASFKDAVDTVIDVLKALKTAWDTVAGWLDTAFWALYNFGVSLRAPLAAVKASFDEMITAITGAVEAVKTKAVEIADAIVEAFTGLPAEMLSIGSNIVSGLVDGLKSKLAEVKAAAAAVANAVKEKLGAAGEAVTGALGGAKEAVTGFFGFGKDDVDGERANGGPVSFGKSYLVGERGPEIFSPSVSGTIIPNGAANSNSVMVNQTVTINAIGEGDLDRILAKRSPQLKNMMLAAIRDEQRRGAFG